jgi:hypothetical protein
MAGVSSALESVAGLLSGVAASEAARFRDRRLVIRRSRVVHDLGWLRWMAGVRLPSPACHIGVAGFALEDLHPTSDPVTCLRCLRANPATAPGGELTERLGQLSLAIELP